MKYYSQQILIDIEVVYIFILLLTPQHLQPRFDQILGMHLTCHQLPFSQPLAQLTLLDLDLLLRDQSFQYPLRP